MAKSTKASGGTFTEHELSDPNPPPVVHRAMLGGAPSVGTDSSERLSKESQSSESETVNPQEPAQTMGSPSPQTGMEDSTANSTDGDGQTETVKPYDEWTVEELREECRVRELTVSGRKDELISRLEQDDAESDEDPGEFE